MEKKEYTTPELVVYGDVNEITLSNQQVPLLTDAVFPVGTPPDQITYGNNIS